MSGQHYLLELRVCGFVCAPVQGGVLGMLPIIEPGVHVYGRLVQANPPMARGIPLEETLTFVR